MRQIFEERPPSKYYLSPRACRGILQRAAKQGRPYIAHATIERSEGDNVPVLLWKVSVRDEACLDLYEGFPRYYGKVNLPVELDGKTVTAMAYVMQPGFDYNEPSPFYLDTIRDGYRAAGFDQAVLDKALKGSRQEMGNEPQWNLHPH